MPAKNPLKSRCPIALCLIGIGLALVFCRAAWAQDDAEPAAEATAEPAPEAGQQYERLPVNEELKKTFLAISPMLMAGKFAPGQEADFDKYYQQYFLPRWTDPKYLTKLPDFRKELRNSHLGKKSAGTQVHDHLTALLLDFMKKLIEGRYHPAVKINAMLMIGELNSVEPPTATPLPEALQYMIGAVSNTDLPDAVRAAAMVGIQRHVALKISDAEARRKLTAALLKIASEELPAGLERPGREWILGQAIDTLGSLGEVGEGNAVYKAMVAAVGNRKLSLSTRGIAAQSLGRLNYGGTAGIKPAEAAAALGQFLADVCSDMLKKAKDSEHPIARRCVQQYLLDVQTALEGDGVENHKGIAPLATAPNQQAVGKLQKLVDGTAEKIAKAGEDDDLTEPVDQLQGDLEELLK